MDEADKKRAGYVWQGMQLVSIGRAEIFVQLRCVTHVAQSDTKRQQQRSQDEGMRAHKCRQVLELN